MAEQAMISSLEQRYRALSAQLSRLPLSFWRQLLVVVALLWLCHSLARLVWTLFPAPELPVPPVLAVQTVVENATSEYTIDLIELQREQIFGEGTLEVELPPKQEIKPGIENNAAKTQLNLGLVGVLASNINEESTAIIAKGSEQDIYQIDDKLPVGANVTLAKILSDRVILNNNGKYESLWLYSEADFKVKYSYSSSVDRDDEVSGRGAPAPTQIQSKIKASEVPKSISDVVRFSVHRENGQMLGFRIRPGKNKELFERLGLKANDIVTSVNGIPIDTPQAIRDNYQQLKSATTADLEVQRGEETVYINVSLDSASD